MLGLILDTSTEQMLLALCEGPSVLFSTITAGGKKLSTTLFPALSTLLQNARCKIQNLNYIALGIGPGSYMGIRTAATIAKTLAFSHQIPPIGFYSPLAFLPSQKKGKFAFVGDAKMGELFVITGHLENHRLSALRAPLLTSADRLESHLHQIDFIVSPLTLDAYKESLIPPRANLELIAHFAHHQFMQGALAKSDTLSLAYLR